MLPKMPSYGALTTKEFKDEGEGNNGECSVFLYVHTFRMHWKRKEMYHKLPQKLIANN
jgi:hypothetical protein